MKHITVFISLFISFLSHTQTTSVRLVATMDDFHRLEGNVMTHIWGYNYYTPPTYHAKLPAPLLEFTTGDSVNLFFYNDSPEDHTIHLHGLDVEQAMDGVPTTSFPVASQYSTNYIFKAPHPGTYLYHCHVLTTLHLAMGMYGMIIVNDSSNALFENGPSYNKSYPILYSDMYQHWNDNPMSPGPFHLYEADRFLINGKSGTQLFTDTSQVIDAFVGDSIRLNIGNIGYNKATYVFPNELNPTVYLSDGKPIPQPFSTDTLEVYPGERYTVICAPTSYYEGYINVYSQNLKTNTVDGLNFIGVNRYNHPNAIKEIHPTINFYPNPAKEVIHFSENLNTSYTITNINGVIVSSGIIQGNSLSVSSLPNGIYLLQINDLGVFKVIKQE